jgi:hypothetical protein
MQREQNLRRRHEHQERLRNAYLSLYDERKDVSDDMRRTFNNHDNLRQSLKADEMNSKRVTLHTHSGSSVVDKL